MITYNYSGLYRPSWEWLSNAVATSEMVDKNILSIHWESSTTIMEVRYDEALDSSDKTILDGIVAEMP